MRVGPRQPAGLPFGKTQKAHALLPLAVLVDLEILPLGAGGHVYYPHDAACRAVRIERGKDIGTALKKILPKHCAGAVGIDRERDDIGFHKVVKKMGAKRGPDG